MSWGVFQCPPPSTHAISLRNWSFFQPVCFYSPGPWFCSPSQEADRAITAPQGPCELSSHSVRRRKWTHFTGSAHIPLLKILCGVLENLPHESQNDENEARAKVISAGGTWTSFTRPSVPAWGTGASGDNQKSNVISMKASPTSLCGLTAPFFLLLSNIPLSGCTTVYPFAYRWSSWLLPDFSDFKKKLL